MPVERTESGATVMTGQAVVGFAAMSLLMSLKMYIETNGRLRASRAHTPGNMRAAATRFTGKTYARSRKGLIDAFYDLARLMEGKSLDEVGQVHAVNSLVGGVAADLQEAR
jgi:hypothetical protein